MRAHHFGHGPGPAAPESASNPTLAGSAPDDSGSTAHPRLGRQPGRDKAHDAGVEAVVGAIALRGVAPAPREQVVLADDRNEPRADTRVLAVHLGLDHRSVFRVVSEHRSDFEDLAKVRFEIAPSASGRTGQREKFALLTEDQAYLLLTFSRNTQRVRALKVQLVKAFGEVRRGRDLWAAEYLPTYRSLHDEIAELAKGSTNERFVHMNVNKLVNKAIGIDAGMRRGLHLADRSLVVVAQATAERAMHGATDHHDGYARAKAALDRLGTLLVGGNAWPKPQSLGPATSGQT